MSPPQPPPVDDLHCFSAGRPARPLFQTILTAAMPPRERYDFWREAVIRGAVLSDPSPAQRRDFRASLVSLADPLHEVHLCRTEGFQARRDRALVRRDDGDDPALFYVQAGGMKLDADGAVVRAGRGEFLLFDPRRPALVEFEPSCVLQIDLSRAALSRRMGEVPGGPRVAALLRGSPLTGLLRGHLDHLMAVLATLSAVEQASALAATEALALAVLSGAWRAHEEGHEEGTGAAGTGLLAAARRYIEDNLAHPDLGPASIAAALGCSRATLYREFARQDQAVVAAIREARLNRLAALLRHAAPELSVSDLAARCGLYDTANLSRSFRARFGVSPSAFRRQQS